MLLTPLVFGDGQELALPNTLNIAIPGLDSEAGMLALKDVVAISNGSACASQTDTVSHVLAAMGVPEDHVRGALRLSWSHERAFQQLPPARSSRDAGGAVGGGGGADRGAEVMTSILTFAALRRGEPLERAV